MSTPDPDGALPEERIEAAAAGPGERLWGLWAVTRAALALRRQGFEATAGPYLTGAGEGHPAAVAAQRSTTLEALVDRRFRALRSTGRLPWSTCLTRSLALCLSTREVAPAPLRLHLGTRIDGAAIAAHAWVTLGGRSWGREGYEAMNVERPPAPGRSPRGDA